MDSSDITMLVILVFLLIFSGFFSCAETALTMCSSLRMRTMADEGSKKAALVLKITEKKSKMLTAILIGNNVVNLTASSLATLLATKLFGGNLGAGIATGILTLLILIFGEISPKTIATLRAEAISLTVAPVISALMTVLTPVIIAVNFLAGCILKLFRINPDKKDAFISTEEELLTLVDVSHEEGIIEKEEQEMIKSVVDFGDATASDIMIPHEDMTMVDSEISYNGILRIFQRDFYTRLPVYEDNRDNIIGILNMKDLLLCQDKKNFNIRKYMRKPLFTFESRKLSDLLRDMREAYMNIAIVLNEYGGVSGMVTMEDILEEIVGDIRDEFDREESELIVKVSDREYIVQAKVNLDDINDQLSTDLESETYESLGGLVIELLNHFPSAGDTAEYGNIRLEVVDMNRQRVGRVRITLPPEDGNADEDADQIAG